MPCSSEACNFAFDALGIGGDLKLIYSRPIIADLLISMASAACQCTARRDSLFRCVPSNLLLTPQRDDNSVTVSQQESHIDWRQMQEAFAGLPSVARMAKERNLLSFLQDENLESGMRKYRLLHSVLNSCRGHLMQLHGEDQFPMMKTDYQFRLHTDSPSKEAVFAQLKAKHGSRYLFHGSSYHNWHSILSEGLKTWVAASWCQLEQLMDQESIFQEQLTERQTTVTSLTRGVNSLPEKLPILQAFLGEPLPA